MNGTGNRSVVIHADDLGMSHGANAAFAELWGLGVVTSGSVMVPCPWFPELAAMARANAAMDLGVHLTLTSEMSGYRWRPLTRPLASAGLTDADGFFHADVATLRARADREAVLAELRAQIDAALAAGIDITHLDDHMGALLAPEFADLYVVLATEYGLPPVFCRDLSGYGGLHNLQGIGATAFASGAEQARATGFAMFERIAETNWHPTEPPEVAYRALFDSLVPGLSFLALHFTTPGEVSAIDPGFHHIRTAEYELFRSPGFAGWLARQDVVPTGMRVLRDDWRSRNGERRDKWTGSASA